MMNSEFEFIRTLVYSHSRINLGPDKRELVAARLGKRLRATRLSSVGDYCRLLQSGEDGGELSNLIDAISTNHTFFFREIAHFDFLRQRALPEFIARARKERQNSINVWSAASSSGEEAYSIAITLDQELRQSGLTYKIHGTDISHRILEKAKQAIYREEALEHVSSAHAKEYFQKGVGPQEGNYRVKATIRSAVQFHHLNLLEGEPPFNDVFQIIFCRNVMIYFDKATQEELVARLCRRLIPGGYLLVGHSESLTGIKHSLELVQSAVYRKPANA